MAGKRSGQVYRRHILEARQTGDTCGLCGRPLDRSIPWDPLYPDPAYVTSDHIVPIGAGGDELGAMAPVHLICNMRRQAVVDPSTVNFDRPLEWDHPHRKKIRLGPVQSREW